MTPPSKSAKKQQSSAPRTRAGEKWARHTLAKMSLDEKLGQMVVVYYWGRFTSQEDPRFRQLLHRVKENRVGGIMLEARRTPAGIERGQVYPSAALVNELQRVAKIPLLVAADFENGTAMRLEEGTSLPSAMAVAATGDPQFAYVAGKITALEARAAGLNWIFAPVCDVNSNPENPIINTRSYGEDPSRVAEFVSQYIRGVQENGAMATAKHFPGHGNVNTDSHISVPVIPSSAAELERIELVPFRAAIAAGAGAVMSGHLAVPALEPEPDTPATLSPRTWTDLLRKKMGFEGIGVTDALDMGGVTTIDSAPNIAVRAIRAGADVLLIPPNPDAAIAALKQAVESGELPLARVNEAVLRILRAKADLELETRRPVDLKNLNAIFGALEFRVKAQEIADHGITLVRDEQKLLPLNAAKPLRVLLAIVSGDPDRHPGGALEQELRSRVESVQTVRVDTHFEMASAAKLPPSDAYDIAIGAVLVRVADRKGTVGLPQEQAAFLKKLLATSKPVVMASLGNPYLAGQFPEAKTWIAGFGTQDSVQRAMIRAIFGQIAIRGQLPVSVPRVAKIGSGVQLAANPMKLEPTPDSAIAKFKPAFDILERAVADRAFPGGVLAVGLDEKLLLHPFGRLSYHAKSSAVRADTIYDVASLSKVIVTTTAIMMLVAKQQIDLDAPIARYLSPCSGSASSDWRNQITVRQLLLHMAGLPAHREFFRKAKTPADVREQLFAERLTTSPGTKIEYSDLGFILLGEIIERLSGKNLDQFAQSEIFAPLGMQNSFFNPPRALRVRVAPTQEDKTYRKRLLHGEVDDANAYAMGGVAGHAGLFSTVGDIAAFAQMMLNGGIYAHTRILPRSIVNQFAKRGQVGDSARALGWDVPTGESSSGHYFSAQSYGHNGFTGTSIWIDPEKDSFVILLTNRVHPSAANEKIRQVRPALHDAVLEALGFAAEHR